MPEDIPIAELRQWAIASMAAAGVPDPEVDTDLIIGHLLKLGRGEVAAKLVTGFNLPGEHVYDFRQMVGRRAQREPLQHILGVAWFRDLTLSVGPGVFVPRPETEQLAGMAVDALRSLPDPAPIAVDLGTGSGAIALAMATEVPHAEIYAIEKSPDAMPWTTRNFESVAATNAHLVSGDLAGEELLSAYPHLRGAVAVIASNPPYIPSDAIPRDLEVHLHDPDMALYGGADGLDIVRQVSRVALELGRPGAQLMMEHGELQGAEIRELLATDGWRATATHQDLLGRDRFTTGIRP